MRIALLIVVAAVAWALAAGRGLSPTWVRVRWWPLALVATALWLGPGASTDTTVRVAATIVALASLLAVGLVNHDRPGMTALTAGVTANGLVIVANAGMPVSADAVRALGGSPAELPLTGPHHLLTVDTNLSWFADTWGVSVLGAVLSPGDLLVGLGVVGLLAASLSPDPAAGGAHDRARGRGRLLAADAWSTAPGRRPRQG